MQLTALAWNIHKGIGGVDRRYRLDRILAVLHHHTPDIVLLQEVDEDARRSSYHRQVDIIGDELGLSHRLYEPTHRLRWQGHYGNAILARWPISLIHHVDLTIGRKKRRGAIIGRVRVRTPTRSRTVVVVNLHLGLAGSERDQQLQRFLATHPFSGLHHKTPILLGGDFNDLWGTLGPKHLLPAGFRRAGSLHRTFPAYAPLRPLDAIFCRGDLDAHTCRPSRHALAPWASDHLPLVAHLEMR